MKEKIIVITTWENCFCFSFIIKCLLEVLWLKIEIILGRHQFPHLRELWFRKFRFIKYPELEGTWGSWYTFISCLLRGKCLWVSCDECFGYTQRPFLNKVTFLSSSLVQNVGESLSLWLRFKLLLSSLSLLHWLPVTAGGAHEERWWSQKEGFE